MRQVMKLERGRGQPFRPDGDAWQTNSYTCKEDRVREYCETEKINEHRGVPEPGECHLRVTPFPRLRHRKGRRDWPPAFNRPFPE